MIGLVVATHGTLGEALLATVGMIVGRPAQASALSLSRENSPEQVRKLLVRSIAAVDQGEGVLVAADMFGGTPANVGMTLLHPGRIEVLTGVNLPMLLKFVTYRDRFPLSQLAGFLRDHAREGIVVASDVLHRQS